MWTLYSPVAGTVSAVQPDGVTLEAAGADPVRAPADGTVRRLDEGGVVLEDAKGRTVVLEFAPVVAPPVAPVVAPPVAAVVAPPVAEGATVAVDQELYAGDGGGATRSVRVRVAGETLAHCRVGEVVSAGAPLFSVGPFACGGTRR